MILQPGERILNGKYRVERLLGRGAFGEVYLATHLLLDAALAIKVLRRDAPGMGSTEFGRYRDRFLLEAQLGKRLNDPNVVRVDDCIEEAGVLYLVMEFCEGGTLAARLERSRAAGQPMAVDEAVRIAAEVAAGLAALHDLEVVHRDLKPGNILFDRGGRAKVADLGLAQRPGGNTFGSLGGGFQPGTPGYQSPEQAANAPRLRPPSDVYALGAVLFEMLTNRLYDNQRPGTRAGTLRFDVPPWLDDLLARMLAPSPADRPWDGGEVVQALAAGPGLPAGDLPHPADRRSPPSARQDPKATTADSGATPAQPPASDYDRVLSTLRAQSRADLSPVDEAVRILKRVDEERARFFSASAREYIRTRVFTLPSREDGLQPGEVIQAILAVISEGAPSSETARAICDVFHVGPDTLAAIVSHREYYATLGKG